MKTNIYLLVNSSWRLPGSEIKYKASQHFILFAVLHMLLRTVTIAPPHHKVFDKIAEVDVKSS
jgi:hypothetical protein